MTGEWVKLETNKKQDWINFINSFQVNESNFPKNSFIDPEFLMHIQNWLLNRN